MVSSRDTRYLLVDERPFLVSQITFGGYFYGISDRTPHIVYFIQREEQFGFKLNPVQLGLYEYILDVT